MTAPHQQKLNAKGPLVITANRLSDGKVVYRTGEGHWDISLDRAAAISPDDAQNILALARTDYLHVIDPYAAPLRLDAGGSPAPGNLRETIRTLGPSIALPVLD